MGMECKKCNETFSVPDGYDPPESGLCWPCAEIAVVELETRVKVLEAAMKLADEALTAFAVRVAFIGHPNEPHFMDGDKRVPDWSKPIDLKDKYSKALKGE